MCPEAEAGVQWQVNLKRQMGQREGLGFPREWWKLCFAAEQEKDSSVRGI